MLACARVVKETVTLGVLIAAGASALVLHLALLIRTARAPGLSRAMRVLAWLPPVTPVIAWRAGARVRAAAWAVSVAVYCVVRSVV